MGKTVYFQGRNPVFSLLLRGHEFREIGFCLQFLADGMPALH